MRFMPALHMHRSRDRELAVTFVLPSQRASHPQGFRNKYMVGCAPFITKPGNIHISEDTNKLKIFKKIKCGIIRKLKVDRVESIY
jgi:hypothetical protein